MVRESGADGVQFAADPTGVRVVLDVTSPRGEARKTRPAVALRAIREVQFCAMSQYWLELALPSIASWGKLASMIDELAGRRLDADLLARELGNWRTSSASGPAYQGLADGLRMLIVDGRLPVGAQLPSERALADALRVSRTTVTAAYTQMRDDGYLNGRRGARSTTALPARRRAATVAARSPATVNLAAATLAAPAERRRAGVHRGRRTGHALPARHRHRARPASLRCARRSPKDTAPVGFPPTPTRSWSPPAHCTPSALILATYTQPGDRVLVEQPTYHGALVGDGDAGAPAGAGRDDPATAGNSTPSRPRCVSWRRTWPT